VDAPTDSRALLDQANSGADGLESLRDHVFVRELGQGGMGTVSLLRHTES